MILPLDVCSLVLWRHVMQIQFTMQGSKEDMNKQYSVSKTHVSLINLDPECRSQ